MDERSTSSDLPYPQGSHSQWQLLGELTLSNEPAGEEQIRTWLTGLLISLSLPAEFLTRLASAARDAAARALQPDRKLEHIHLKIFGPRVSTTAGQSWGFFQVEKIENAAGADDSASHAVEFYLYSEGPESIDRSQ